MPRERRDRGLGPEQSSHAATCVCMLLAGCRALRAPRDLWLCVQYSFTSHVLGSIRVRVRVRVDILVEHPSCIGPSTLTAAAYTSSRHAHVLKPARSALPSLDTTMERQALVPPVRMTSRTIGTLRLPPCRVRCAGGVHDRAASALRPLGARPPGQVLARPHHQHDHQGHLAPQD